MAPKLNVCIYAVAPTGSDRRFATAGSSRRFATAGSGRRFATADNVRRENIKTEICLMFFVLCLMFNLFLIPCVSYSVLNNNNNNSYYHYSIKNSNNPSNVQ